MPQPASSPEKRKREVNQPDEPQAEDPGENEKPATTKLGKLWKVLNSQFVLWVLGSVVLGGITAYWNYRNDLRLENQRDEEARNNQQREDSEFLVTLLPYLTNSDPTIRLRAVDIIGTRYARRDMPTEIKNVVAKVIEGEGADFENQSSETKRVLANVVRTYEQQPAPDSAVSNAIAQLPARLYLQIFDESQRPQAQGVQAALQKNFLVLGIENVQNKATAGPVTEVRYFNDSDKATADKVVAVLIQQGLKDAVARRIQMSAKPGTVEIWFSKPR